MGSGGVPLLEKWSGGSSLPVLRSPWDGFSDIVTNVQTFAERAATREKRSLCARRLAPLVEDHLPTPDRKCPCRDGRWSVGVLVAWWATDELVAIKADGSSALRNNSRCVGLDSHWTIILTGPSAPVPAASLPR